MEYYILRKRKNSQKHQIMKLYSDNELPILPSTKHITLFFYKTKTQFRESGENLLAAIQHYRCGKCIVDNEHLGAIHPDVVGWMTSACLAMNNNRISKLITRRNFDNIEKAIE
jgi:hypothetical protein